MKKKTTGLNKEWRKKYLVLGEETLTYYPSIQVGFVSVCCSVTKCCYWACTTSLFCFLLLE